MNFLSKIRVKSDLSQLIFAIFVIAFIPGALAFNTIYLLRSVQRDTDFELNNKALLVESVIAIQSREKINEPEKMQENLQELVKTLPEIKALEVFSANQGEISSLSTTSERTRAVADSALNQLAWGTNQAYSKQIFASIGNTPSERVWLVASPIHDSSGKKIGLINLYLSAAQIDSISNRTIKDSLFILVVTMIFILLLLLNHFRFFEISLLFKKLSEVDKLKDDFISIASHELKSPLTIIASYTSLIIKNPLVAQDETLTKHASIIDKSTARLKTLVEDLLDVSRIEQNRVKLEMVECDIREIIRNVINEFLPQAQSKGLRLEYRELPQPLLITCDRDRMHQILANLVSNAIKYTPQIGEVSIYHQTEGGTVRTFVKDTGIGISSENMSKLFSKFSRVYDERTKDVGGTGLGLWITKQLVEKMGGKITVQSIENQGSQFIVAFPLKT